MVGKLPQINIMKGETHVHYNVIASYGKSWWKKLWPIYDPLPNSPTFPPTKVSLHMVLNLQYYVTMVVSKICIT